jgi:DNA repair exonuclease SbcCD ATPase subunit
MKIKEFSIIRYGPLPNTGRIPLTDFNLFFGKNEEGKTLTIDALVKLLLRKNIRDFENIDRIDERPEGYVIIENDKGKEIKLPEEGELTKAVNLTPSEYRNIFIVRNSSLSIARDVTKEGEFYTSVTDRLTGLRTGEISKIKETLREIGKITPTGIFRDTKDERLKTRIEDAENLTEKIESLKREIKEKKFDEIEEESISQRERIENIEQEIKSLENARKREKYEKGKKSLDNLKESLEKLGDLEIYNEEDKQLWRDCEKYIKTYGEEKKKGFIEIQKNEKEFKEISEKLSEIERDFRVLDERKKKLDDEIKPDLKNYETRSEELAQQEGKNKFFTSVGIISVIIFVISLSGIVFSSSILFKIFAAIFLVSSITSGILMYQFIRNKSQIAKMFKKNRLSLSRFELDAENIEGILSNVQSFDEEYRKNNDKIQEIKIEKKNLEGKIKELRDKEIPELENKIRSTKEKIGEIKIKSGESSLGEYVEKLKSKEETEKSIGKQESVLKSLFGEEGKELEENISYWSREIGEIEEYKDKAKDMKYSENIASELEEKKRGGEKKMEEINERMKSLQDKMREIERKANEILRLEEPLYCDTSVDLKAIKDKLQGFIDQNKTNKDNALEVMKIFEAIEAEEKGRVSELFGKESPISNYFNEITDGFYDEVNLNQKTMEIEVKCMDGKILGAQKLSGGTYDQLYLSIRLALGEKLLKGKKGFFIMDDPFIKADPDRLKRQIDVLRRISKLGWQIIYFSAKEEIKNAFKQYPKINYIKFPGIQY